MCSHFNKDLKAPEIPKKFIEKTMNVHTPN